MRTLEKDISKKSLNLIIIFVIMMIIYFCVFKSWWFLLLLGIATYLLFFSQLKKWFFVYGLLMIMAYCTELIFVDQINVFAMLQVALDDLFNFSLRQTLIDYINSIYDESITSFINLILFNIKESEIYDLYNQTINIAIVSLISISGFHLNFLNKIIGLIFKKVPKVNYVISNLVILFYSYLLSFSFSSLRVLFTNLNRPWVCKLTSDKLDNLCISSFIILFICPHGFTSYSFMMSYLGTIAVICIVKLEINNKFFETILINIFATLINLPFVLSMNNEISLFAFINGFVFSYIFSFLYVYFLFFAWISILLPIHQAIISIIYFLIGSYDYSNILIQLNALSSYASNLYYLGWFFIYILCQKITNLND